MAQHDWSLLVIATLVTGRLAMCIPALAFVLNQTNISFFAMAISYTAIFSVLYLVLLGTIFRDVMALPGKVLAGSEKIFATPVMKVSRKMGALFLFDYVIFMAWFWRWLDKNNRMGLGKDAPTTSDPEFCSAQFLMQLFIIVGILYFSVVMNYVIVKFNLGSAQSLERKLEIEIQNMKADPVYYVWLGFTFAQYAVGILYCFWMFLMAVGLPPRLSVDSFFWMWLSLACLWVISTIMLTIFAWRKSQESGQALVSFWSELLTGKLFWALWNVYNIIFYANAFEKDSYKTGSDPKFVNGAVAQNQLFVVWQPFAVTNGVLLVYMVYHFVTVLTLSVDVIRGSRMVAAEMEPEAWESIKIKKGSTGYYILTMFISIATLYQVVHAFFIFSELLEEHYLNKRLEAWAIAYTVIFGVVIAYIIIAMLMKWLDTMEGNVAPRLRVTAIRLLFSLSTLYFQGAMFYWYGVTKFNGDIDDPLVTASLATRNITDSSTKVSFYWWNLLATMLGIWFVGMMLLGEAYSDLNITELGKIVPGTPEGEEEEEEEEGGMTNPQGLLESFFPGEVVGSAVEGTTNIAGAGIETAGEMTRRGVRTAEDVTRAAVGTGGTRSKYNYD